MKKIWLGNYPKGIPAEIDPNAFGSLRDMLQKSCLRYASLPAFSNMGSSISFDEHARSGLAEAGAVTLSHLTYQGTAALGGLNLKAGSLTLTTAGVVGALESTAGTTLRFGGSLSADVGTGITKTVAGDLSGAGSLTKAGAGTLVLSGVNAYTGSTTIQAGTAYNVIPETASIQGTLRAVSAKTRSNVHSYINQVANGIASAHGLVAEVDIELGYPVTVNDHQFAGFASDVATAILGDQKVIQMPNPVMAAEDFSYVLERLPGAMMFLGGTSPDKNTATAAPNHSNHVVFDEDAMAVGASLYSAMALRHLGVRLT